MAKASRAFVCQACGAVTSKWSGKCAACGEWNSIIEEAAPSGSPALVAIKGGKGRLASFESLAAVTRDAPRLKTGIAELDRVLGGGLVPGSAVLVGGDPGIGKSTLLLQAAAKLAEAGLRVVYLSGEEAPAQVRLRAARLGLADAPVALGTETNLANIVATLGSGPPPALVIIDSVQTLWSEAVEAAPGTISQLRGSASALISYAKTSGATLVLVGHVTKDGQIAGPKVIEHMVDTVLYFENLSGHQFRLLRAVKNRFGPTDEIGVFEMRFEGLKEVENPSALFLSDHDRGAPGTAVFAGMEGTRPILVEIQALVAPSALGTPRRAVVGWDPNRLSMLIAVLEARCGVRLADHDVYLNVAGGLRLNEPAADLAAAAALLSSYAGRSAHEDTVFFGEVSLTGAVRAVGHMDQRLKEAAKLGFARAVVPAVASEGDRQVKAMTLMPLSQLEELVALLSAPAD
ncbi:MAG: DNA repair protein RadA [Methyloceanibacter sp.]|uniref:DNA repair protein RadA n=1 Tax=Methyloceanibacter sp. TaxID=1965321 RepID=UPI003D9B72F1